MLYLKLRQKLMLLQVEQINFFSLKIFVSGSSFMSQQLTTNTDLDCRAPKNGIGILTSHILHIYLYPYMYVYCSMYVDVLTEQPFFLPVFVLLFMNEWSQTLISISISEYDQGYSLECHQFCLDLCGLFLLKLKMIVIIIYVQ